MMPKIPKPRLISLDTETTGLDLYHGARPFFVSTCDGDGNNAFWEWDVDPVTRLPEVPKADLKEIQETVDSADLLILQNPKFDYKALETVFGQGKLRWDWKKVRDTLLAGHLLRTNQPHDLTTMAMVYLNENIKPYEDAIQQAAVEARKIAKSKYPDWRIAKKGLLEMPTAKEKTWGFDMWLPRHIALLEEYPENHDWFTVLQKYSNSDSAVTLSLYLAQERLLKNKGLWEIYLERLKLLSIVCSIEDRGITINKPRLVSLQRQYLKESDTAGKECIAIARKKGYELELPKSGNNKSLTDFIFNGLKLPQLKHSEKTGAPSLDKTVLEQYESTLGIGSQALTFIKQLRAKRQRDTAISYAEGYEKYWIPMGILNKKGEQLWYRLHPSLNPTGTDTLRWSSSNPNEQNISKKEGFNLRYLFGPAPGREWWSLDYENIELRIPAYESNERVMTDLFEKPDEAPYFGSYHLLNFHLVYPELFEPLCSDKGAIKKKYGSTYYQWIKNFGFAKSYGAGPETADRAARRKGAYAIVDKRLQKHAGLNQAMIELANKQGYVETIPDKTVNPERGYPIYCSRSKWGRVSPTIPLNYHVQSTAMWCTMKAMIRCHEYLQTLPEHYIVLQAHDEMVFDFPKGGKSNLGKIRRIKYLMEKSGDDIGIPLKVAISYHPETWAESKEL